MDQRIIVGCGYIGRQVALAELAQKREVMGVVRTAASRVALLETKIPALQADLDYSAPSGLVTRASVIYYFIAPPSAGAAALGLDQHYRCLR